MLLTTLPWNLAPDLPWRFYTPPTEKWATQPSFVVGEILFIGLALLALWHASKQPNDSSDNQRRRHLLAWGAALLAGTVNDVIFMALPLVDNFWQAQAIIMLTPRLPLYIPCVYVCFMYFPTVAVWRFGLPPLAGAALSGLAGSLFYAPYDIVGAKFLWWTWHDSDMPINNRLLGAPIGSTMWVITFVAAFAWLLTRALRSDPAVSSRTVAKALALVGGLSTLAMMVQMTALQQLDGGVPGVISLITVIALYLGLIAREFGKRQPRRPQTAERVLLGGAIAYFGTLAVVMAVFEPETHHSASLHQTYGPCHIEQKDITGMTRFKYVCVEDYDEDYHFGCVKGLPAAETDWYTVCGKGHSDFPLWLGGVAGLGVLGVLVYAGLLVRGAPPKGSAAS